MAYLRRCRSSLMTTLAVEMQVIATGAVWHQIGRVSLVECVAFDQQIRGWYVLKIVNRGEQGLWSPSIRDPLYLRSPLQFFQ